jgi:hypothetical protein
VGAGRRGRRADHERARDDPRPAGANGAALDRGAARGARLADRAEPDRAAGRPRRGADRAAARGATRGARDGVARRERDRRGAAPGVGRVAGLVRRADRSPRRARGARPRASARSTPSSRCRRSPAFRG